MPRPRNDKEDYEDDREEPRPRRRPKRDSEAGSGSGLMMILLIGGGALLGVLLLCGVGTFLIVRNAKWAPNTEVLSPPPSRETHQHIEAKWKQSHAAAATDQRRALAFLEYWLALIRIDDLDGAYRRTTAAYQARVSRAQFGQHVLQLQDRWDPHLPWTFGHNDNPGNRFKFELRRHWLTAAREGDEWKLEEMEIRPGAR